MAAMKALLTPATCRASRALLDWTQDRLAQEAEVGITTVRTFERGSSQPVAQNLAAIQRTLVAGGVVFTFDDKGEVCVRLRSSGEE